MILLCAVTMGVGTAAGGWRIIKTMGLRLTKLEPIHGFAAETAAGLTIMAAGQPGHPAQHHAHDQHRRSWASARRAGCPR